MGIWISLDFGSARSKVSEKAYGQFQLAVTGRWVSFEELRKIEKKGRRNKL